MSPLTQIVIAAVGAGLPTLTVLVSLLINNQRLTDLGNRMSDFEKRVNDRFNEFEKRVDNKFEVQRDLLRSEFLRVEQVMDARLKHLEESFQR